MIHKSAQNGQTLLVFILLMTISITTVLSIVQSTIQDNQIAQLEEQGKRAFSAAEAGLEAALKRGENIANGELSFPGIKNLSANFVTTPTTNYVTPLLENNKQTTFYMTGYNSQDGSFGVPALPSSQLMEVLLTDIDVDTMCNSATTRFALELTFINTTSAPPSLFRRLIDPCSLVDDTVDEWQLNSQTEIGAEANLLILRAVGSSPAFRGARLTLRNNSGQWPAQGREIVSEAETSTGVVKRIRLISSYPQIPSSLFVPSF